MITGIKAFLNACLKIKVLRSNPFAFARIIYSLVKTETISVRVKRATFAITPTDKAKIGIIDDLIAFDELYEVGNNLNFEANSNKINIANTNDGMETPITEITVAIVSQIVFLCNAANTPKNIPITVPIITAHKP